MPQKGNCPFHLLGILPAHKMTIYINAVCLLMSFIPVTTMDRNVKTNWMIVHTIFHIIKRVGYCDQFLLMKVKCWEVPRGIIFTFEMCKIEKLILAGVSFYIYLVIKILLQKYAKWILIIPSSLKSLNIIHILFYWCMKMVQKVLIGKFWGKWILIIFIAFILFEFTQHEIKSYYQVNEFIKIQKWFLYFKSIYFQLMKTKSSVHIISFYTFVPISLYLNI